MILAIDTAGDTLGLALFDGQRIVAEEEIPVPGRHTVELAPAVEAMLRRAGTTPAGIRALAVAQGPGSYTALRIGIAFAEGFAIQRNLPVVGVPTFDILAQAQPPAKTDFIAVIRAGRGRVAWCAYRSSKTGWQPAGEACVSTWAELAERAPRKARLGGDIDRTGQAALAKRRDLKIEPPHCSIRRAGVLAELAAVKLAAGAGRPELVRPIYLPTPETKPLEPAVHDR